MFEAGPSATCPIELKRRARQQFFGTLGGTQPYHGHIWPRLKAFACHMGAGSVRRRHFEFNYTTCKNRLVLDVFLHVVRGGASNQPAGFVGAVASRKLGVVRNVRGVGMLARNAAGIGGRHHLTRGRWSGGLMDGGWQRERRRGGGIFGNKYASQLALERERGIYSGHKSYTYLAFTLSLLHYTRNAVHGLSRSR